MPSVRAPAGSGRIFRRSSTAFGSMTGAMIMIGLTPLARADEVPPPALKHGINLSNWFADAGRQPLAIRDFE